MPPTPFQLYSPATMSQSLAILPALPLLAALALGLFGRRIGRGNVALIACGSVFVAFAMSSLIIAPMTFVGLLSPVTEPLSQSLGTWFQAGEIAIVAGLSVDHLTAVMLMVVTLVGFVIHVYAVGYMEHEDDAGFARFFAYTNLFIGMMLILVLADSLVLMFVGWEGVGLCSYLLIGFWYTDEEKAAAGRKAMVVNRIGDLGFLLGIFSLFALFHTVGFAGLRGASHLTEAALSQVVTSGPFSLGHWTLGEALTLALVFLFIGACGKSAQLPLYVWLPDAMAGPTPVSALIHAATMVTAGVYMVTRLNFLYVHSPTAMAVVTVVGALTALFAALIALTQNDIKKVLAYSTVSQLGYMFIAAGVGAYWAAILHLATHAFFKALLFLCAGSVMHGLHDETDIRKMGGLKEQMPETHWTFLVGTLAITGVAPLSGFFSKEAILHAAHTLQNGQHAWAPHFAYLVGLITAGLTALYMFRLYFLTFSGSRRSSATAHESPKVMWYPLGFLALCSILTAFYGLPILSTPGPAGYVAQPPMQNFLIEPTREAMEFARRSEAVGAPGGEAESTPAGSTALKAAALAVAHEAPTWIGPWILVLAAFGFAWFLFRRGGGESFGAWLRKAPAMVRVPAHAAWAASSGKFFVDEIYEVFIVAPVKFGAFALWKVADVFAIDGLIAKVLPWVTRWAGSALRLLQNGNAQRYATVMAIAVAVALWAVLKG